MQQNLLKTIHTTLDEVLLALFGGGSATLGWLVVANQYLQALAFIVSIIAGVLAIRSHLIKRRQIKVKDLP